MSINQSSHYSVLRILYCSWLSENTPVYPRTRAPVYLYIAIMNDLLQYIVYLFNRPEDNVNQLILKN